MEEKKMIIEFTGLKLGKHEYKFQIPRDFFQESSYNEITLIQGDVIVSFDKRENMMELEAHFDLIYEFPCDRCGEDYQHPMQFEEKVIYKIGDEAQSTDEIINIGKNDYQIILDNLFFEWLIINLPMQRVHPDKEDGSEGCPAELLEKLEQVLGSETYEEEQIDERWSALKDLLTKK
ncbi:MAG: DUF177 domain-containing protein [Flavobacteriales bacterium]|jgi:uncharacterized metal-binding protein YceD (DUF177 family)|nr:DUF177 domain-containing protein [Flavobacteriales bacterium]